MNLEKVVFGFFIILALTLNFGFFLGEIDNPAHHNVYELFAAIVVNLIATVLKFGDRTQTGALLLATSLVAVLQLFAAAAVWSYAVNISTTGMDGMMMASIVSLAGGAMLANVISVVLLIADTVNLRR
jgi:Ca2+/H+ antiporter, TMEM165/GDT1 family